MDLRTVYGSTATITVTGLPTLANATSATSDVIDNTSDLFLDSLVELVVETASGATTSGYIEIYAKGSIDNTDYDDDNNDKWIGTINLVTGGVASRKRVCSVAASFGGSLPPYWKVRVRNVSGAAFNGTATLQVRGVKAQSI